MQGAAFQFDPESFRSLIEQAVEAAMARLEQARATVGDRLCYSEPEAAAMLGLEPHQLRDERLRGRIKASSIVCRRIRYTRQDLMEYLISRPWTKNDSTS
jgi:hypothetical protein